MYHRSSDFLIDSCVQISADKGAQHVDRSALLKHAERVSAELAVVHAQLRERELTVEDAQQRAAAAMHSAQEVDAAARTHRCAPKPDRTLHCARPCMPFCFGSLIFQAWNKGGRQTIVFSSWKSSFQTVVHLFFIQSQSTQ